MNNYIRYTIFACFFTYAITFIDFEEMLLFLAEKRRYLNKLIVYEMLFFE